jgi:hypothetical protein
MWPFKKKVIDPIALMIEQLNKINQLPKDKILKWRNSVPIYNKKVSNTFEPLNKYWIDYDYLNSIDRVTQKDISTLELNEIKTVLTHIWRAEHFGYGSIGNAISSGATLAIEKRLKELEINMQETKS